MTYAVLQDLVDRAGEIELLQVADRDDDGVADASVVAAALTAADQVINGYLGTRFAMPLSTVPPIVRTWAVSIARYGLHRDGAPDHVVRDYKDAMAALRDAGAGGLSLPGLDGSQPAAGQIGAVTSDGPEPVFGRDNLAGWL